MSTLTFGVKNHVWHVTGHRGTVTFRADGVGGADGAFHSRLPFYTGQEPSDTCRHVDHPCYGDTLARDRSRELYRKWIESGHDDEVIRAELERLYDSQLPVATA